MEPGKSEQAMLAKTVLRPTVKAATTIQLVDKSFGELDLTALVGALCEQVDAVLSGELGRAEELLFTQAQTLDAVFHQLARIAVDNLGNIEVSEAYMRLALRAQTQSRATLGTLAIIKNPSPVAFVRQANIAHGPQQINNVATPASDSFRTHESENQPNKLLEREYEEWLDSGAMQAAISGDSSVEALGAVHGTKDDRG
jgi:hypothetical protein